MLGKVFAITTVIAALVLTSSASWAGDEVSATSACTDVETIFWQSIMTSRSRADYEAYLQEYADGKFATLARVRVASLSGDVRGAVLIRKVLARQRRRKAH